MRQKKIITMFVFFLALLILAAQASAYGKILTEAEKDAVIYQKSTEKGLDPNVMKAIIKIESANRGFYNDGFVVVRFEDHIFRRYSTKTPPPGHGKQTFQQALAIDRDAALLSTSYGLGQVMGFNYKKLNYNSVEEMYENFQKGEEFQIKGMVDFITANSKLVEAVKQKDWATIARIYNGAGYRENRYDEKLRDAYDEIITKGGIKPNAVQPGTSGFRFIILSDVNPGFDREVLNARFPAALAGIPQHNPAFVLHAGDMVGGGGRTKGAAHIDNMWNPFFSAIKAITDARIPYFPSPGNHDIGYRNKDLREGYKRNWIKNYPNPAYTVSGNYPYYYSFDYMNNHFIMLDSSNIKLGEAQKAWLTQDLANMHDKDNTFVIMHVPFISDGFGHRETADRSALEMIEAAGVKTIFAGHNHVYSQDTYKGLTQITIGTAADDLRSKNRVKLKDHIFLVVDVLGKNNVKIYTAAQDSGFTKTLEGETIPPAPSPGASFSPNSLIGRSCVPGANADAMSSLLSGDGISYQKEPVGSGFFHAITVDPNMYDIKLISAKSAVGKKTATTAEIMRNTPGAVAAINGGFFQAGGAPSKTSIEKGNINKISSSGYTFMDENGKYKIIRSSQLSSLYSAEQIKNSIISAIGGLGLVFNGDANTACQTKKCNIPAPRTGVCITKDGLVKLIAIHGVPVGSAMKGGFVSIKRFGELALEKQDILSCVNLDGGGSTSMEYHINGQDISLKGERSAKGCSSRGFPCQRRVGNALVVVPKSKIKRQGVAALPPSKALSVLTGGAISIDSITGNSATGMPITGMAARCPDFSAISSDSKREFFETYWPYAIKASNGAKELAKFTLAQAALESGWGRSGLTKDANNFFGVKGAGDAGNVVKRTREVYGGREAYVDATFAKYSSPEASFKAHNDLLEKSRYKDKRQQLFGTSDMTKLTALQILEATKKAGYATDPEYIELVTPIIKDLEKGLSCLGPSNVIQSPTPPNQQIGCVCTKEGCSYGYEYGYVSIGKYSVNPSFAAEVDYNINDYQIITDKVNELIAKCDGESSDSLRSCVEDTAKRTYLTDNLIFYNGPCDYQENMLSDVVEWADACLSSKDDNCECEIPLEYEYQKKGSEEEIEIDISGSTVSSGNLKQSVKGVLSSKTIETKSSAESYTVKKSGNTLTFDESAERACRVEKLSYKFCAETKKLYPVFDSVENKVMLKPIQYKFAVGFPSTVEPAIT